jgi:Tol biopolymer transport system component
MSRRAVPRKPEVLDAGCGERGGLVRRVLTRDLLDRVPRPGRTARRVLVGLVTAALALGVAAIVSIGQPATAAVSPGVTQRLSVADNGAQGAASSSSPSVSADGRYVAFASNAPFDPLDAGNDAGAFGDSDVYVRDTVARRTTLMSRGQAVEGPSPSPTDGGPVILAVPRAVGDITDVAANGASFDPSISANGRYIAFTTQATNIPANSTNSNRTVICDRDADGDGVFGNCTYTKVGDPGAFVQSAVLDANANRLAFIKDFRTVEYVDLVKSATGAIAPTSDAEFRTAALPASLTSGGAQFNLGFAQQLAISGDGRFLAIVEDYRSATSSSGFPLFRVLFVYNVATGTATRLDLGENGAPLGSVVGSVTNNVESVSISGDGRRVAFGDSATNAPDPLVYVVDRDPDGNGVFGPATGEAVRSAIVSRDKTGKTVGGVAPALSADGRYVAFDSDAANVHNGVDDTIQPDSCVHPGSDAGLAPAATPVDTGISFCDVVVRDLVVDAARAAAGQPRLPAELASPSTQIGCLAFVPGATCEGHGDSFGPVLVADGSAVIYPSLADDLVAGDTNATEDVFIRRFTPGPSVPDVDFGSVPVGDETTLAVPVSTNGFGPLRLTGVSISGPNASEFVVFPSESCTGALLHETETCTVSIRFRPTVEGTRTAVLIVRPAGGKAVGGQLRGTGGPRRTPNFKAEPDPLDFGSNVVLLPTAPKTVTVTNTGTAPLVITAVAAIGTAPTGFPGDYTVNASNCLGAPVPPAGTCQVSVVFTAQAVGGRPALLQFTDNAASLPQVVALAGSGAPPTLVASPPLARPGGVSQVIGTGFPPNKVVVVTLLTTPMQVSVTASATGTFTVPLVVFPHTPLGKKRLQASAQGVPNPVVVAIDFLVVPGSLQPPDFAERR